MRTETKTQIATVHQRLLRGENVVDIAKRLGRSTKTVNTHKYRVRAREGADNDVQLLRAYLTRLAVQNHADKPAEWRKGYRRALEDALNADLSFDSNGAGRIG